MSQNKMRGLKVDSTIEEHTKYLILVEGKHDRIFLERYLLYLQKNDKEWPPDLANELLIDPVDGQGNFVARLSDHLDKLQLHKKLSLCHIAIVMDADASVQNAKAKINKIFVDLKLPKLDASDADCFYMIPRPDQPNLTGKRHSLKTSCFIMQGPGQNVGSLESLMLAIFQAPGFTKDRLKSFQELALATITKANDLHIEQSSIKPIFEEGTLYRKDIHTLYCWLSFYRESVKRPIAQLDHETFFDFGHQALTDLKSYLFDLLGSSST